MLPFRNVSNATATLSTRNIVRHNSSTTTANTIITYRLLNAGRIAYARAARPH